MQTLSLFQYSLLCCLLLTPAAPAHSEPTELPLVTGYWTPYVDQKLERGGVIAEVVKSSVALMQRSAVFVWLPWSRGEEYVAKGLYFATFPYAKNTRRQRYFHFSDPLYFVETRFFHNKLLHPSIDFKTLQDLKGYRIGAVRGYGYVDRLKRAELEVYYVNHAHQLVDMLVRNRVDIIAVNGRSGWRMLKQKYPQRIAQYATLEKPLNKRHGVHLMVSRSYPDYLKLTEEFNRALAQLKSSGEYDDILARSPL